MLHFNLIKIRSLTGFHLLKCCSIGDLRKNYYGSHENDPMYHPMKIANARLLNCYFACYVQSGLVEKGHNCIYHIIIYSWHKIAHMWPIMGFPQILHVMTFQLRKASERCDINQICVIFILYIINLYKIT
jgi:hypothetical protein